MEAAHQYFEVDVPRHLKTVELVPVVFAGEPNCGSEGAAMQLSGGGAATISMGSMGSLDEQRSVTSSNGGRDMFSPRLWCTRKSPSILLHALSPFAIAASVYGCSSNIAPAASLLVATHTLGVGCAGQRVETARLLPLLLLPHATVVWHIQAFAQRLPRSSCDSLCRLVAAARITDAQLTSSHPEQWERQRALVLVVHNIGASSGCLVPIDNEEYAMDNDDDGNDGDEYDGDSPKQRSSSPKPSNRGELGQLQRLTVPQLLSAIPADRAALLTSAFGLINVYVEPYPVASRPHVPSSMGAPHDDHRPLLQHVMRTCADNLLRTRCRGGQPTHAALNVKGAAPTTVVPPGAASKIAPPASTAAAVPGPNPAGFGLPNALLLSRYFAEGAIRMPSIDVMQLPLLVPPSLLDPAHAGGIAVRQLRSGFAVQDALSVLRHAIVSNLSSDPVWTVLLAPPKVTSAQLPLPEPTKEGETATRANDRTVAVVASPGDTEGTANMEPPLDAKTQLRALCDAELQRVKTRYFGNAFEVSPAVVAAFLEAATPLVEELLRDAGRRAAEAQRAKLQQKLIEHFERIAPLLERALQSGRFTA